MPNNETIERIAEHLMNFVHNEFTEDADDREAKKTEVLSALSEMRTVALREAAEIARNKYGNEFKIAGEGIAAAILGRIDK